MKLTFDHQGRQLQLVKHPRFMTAYRQGEMSKSDLAASAWYFRHQGRMHSLKTDDDKEAIRRARDHLRAQVSEPDKFQQFLAQEKARKGVTLTTLATDWKSLRCPRPNGSVRTEKQIDAITPFLTSALLYWGERPAAGVKMPDLGKYAAWREANAKKGCSGKRSVDLELNTLSLVCQWAKADGRLDANPFAARPRFQEGAAVKHCHDFAPQSDEELHRLIGWFMESKDLRQVVAGGHLMFCALTGLRPGEPGALLVSPSEYQPGFVSTHQIEGASVTRIRLQRTKAGLNPGARVHPVLAEFLETWKTWLAIHVPKATHLFPDPDSDKPRPLVPVGLTRVSRLSRDLADAVAQLGLPNRHAHGMRAYYVRVRRSQGTDDSTIAAEIGHTGGSNLVARTYGDPGDMFGSGRYDWRAAQGEPCWATLRQQSGNVIALSVLG